MDIISCATGRFLQCILTFFAFTIIFNHKFYQKYMVSTTNNIAKNIKCVYNDCNVYAGSDMMKRPYLTAFETRQEMFDSDYEIFHRIDAHVVNIAPHSHDFYELYCPLSEGINLIAAGKRYVLKPGMLLLIAPGELHRPDIAPPPRPFERIVLWMNADFLAALAGDLPGLQRLLSEGLKGRNLIVPDPDTYSTVLALLFALLREKRLRESDSPALERLMISQILIHLNRRVSQASPVQPPRAEQRDAGVMRVYEYIDSHLSEPLSVAGLAELFFMDKNTLTRQFKRLTGMTPGECIRQRRLEAAHTMIANGAGMQEACAECGFSDYSAFYRAFRQTYGVGPRAFAAQREKR